MHPFSYSGLKIIHDEKVQEALEQQRPYIGQEMQRQGLLQTLATFFARFNKYLVGNKKGSLPGCDAVETSPGSC